MDPQQLINMGFYLFPIVTNGKAPARKGWQEHSSNNLQEIQGWLANPKTKNLGVDCGKSGIVVVDVDNKKGRNGSAVWQKLADENGGNIETPVFKTPSGGFHIVYRDPEHTLRNRENLGGTEDDKTGIDIRGIGGLIVAPGSTIDGKAYEVVASPATADVPAWVRAKIGEQRVQAKTESAIPEDRIDDDDLVDAAIAYLEAAEPAVQGGTGDSDTFKLACEVKDIGISKEMCLELMADHWNDRCSPPWRLEGPGQDQSLQDKVWSAYKSGQNAVGCDAGTANALLAFGNDPLPTPEQQYQAPPPPQPPR